MFQRAITPHLLKAVSKFAVVVLTGPRQSGKTTLLKMLFPDFQYITLESPDQLTQVKEDPRGFLSIKRQGLIIDEAQNFPDFFSYLQEFVDNPAARYPIILSGSQNFLLLEKVTQTLAGRAAIFELLPLSYAELLTQPQHEALSLWEYILSGSYPRPYQEKLPIEMWYESYIKTYLERDVRSILQVKDLSQFQMFLKFCASQHAQEFNASTIASALGVSQTTVMSWLSILEASYIVFRLPPYYKNFHKRLTKRPKLYFYDTGIVCRLLNIQSVEQLYLSIQRGAIFEGFIISEIIKSYLAEGKRASLYYWREHSGPEVDLLIEKGDRLLALEMKSSATFSAEWLLGLERLKKVIQDIPLDCQIIYAGENTFNIKETLVSSWKVISAL